MWLRLRGREQHGAALASLFARAGCDAARLHGAAHYAPGVRHALAAARNAPAAARSPRRTPRDDGQGAPSQDGCALRDLSRGCSAAPAAARVALRLRGGGDEAAETEEALRAADGDAARARTALRPRGGGDEAAEAEQEADADAVLEEEARRADDNAALHAALCSGCVEEMVEVLAARLCVDAAAALGSSLAERYSVLASRWEHTAWVLCPKSLCGRLASEPRLAAVQPAKVVRPNKRHEPEIVGEDADGWRWWRRVERYLGPHRGSAAWSTNTRVLRRLLAPL